MNRFNVPSNESFLAESIRFLQTCSQYCTCPDGWHFSWSAYKAAGFRRSVYFQQPLLQKMMMPILPSVRNVLIAGMADAGILSILASIFGKQVIYSGFDICAAPLEDARQYAAEQGLSFECHQMSLQEFIPDRTYDLIFVHNTLMFLRPQQATQVLRQLRAGMRPDSWMVCGMRYELDAVGLSQTSPQALAEETRAMVYRTYAGLPDIAALVDPHIDAYAQERCLNALHAYTPKEFEFMFTNAGYDSRDCYSDSLTPVVTLSSVPTKSSIRSDVHLLRLV